MQTHQEIFFEEIYEVLPNQRQIAINKQIRSDYLIHLEEHKNISPWGSQQFRKTFQPGQYYKTIQSYLSNNNQSIKQLKNQGQNLGFNIYFQTRDRKFLHKNLMRKSYSVNRDQSHISKAPVKLIKMNVNFEDDVKLGSYKNKGLSIQTNIKNVDSRQLQLRVSKKQQPMRMKIFKKILQKNSMLQEDKQIRKKIFLQSHVFLSQQPFLQKQTISKYPVLPKRNLKIHRKDKFNQSLQDYESNFLPKVSIPVGMSTLFCKGESKYKCEHSQKSRYRKIIQLQKTKLDQKVFLLSDLSKQN